MGDIQVAVHFPQEKGTTTKSTTIKIFVGLQAFVVLQLKTGKLGKNVAFSNLYFVYLETWKYSSCCPFPTGGGNNNQKYHNDDNNYNNHNHHNNNHYNNNNDGEAYSRSLFHAL